MRCERVEWIQREGQRAVHQKRLRFFRRDEGVGQRMSQQTHRSLELIAAVIHFA